MVEGVKFVLVGKDVGEMGQLANCLRHTIADVVVATLSDAEQFTLAARHVVLIDIDCESGLRTAHRVACQSPGCLVATLSDRDRPADRLMHIIKPLGFIDVQILLIRVGAVTY